jgi:purine catabolism regulator
MGRKLRLEGSLKHHDELIPYLVLAQNPLLAERFVKRQLGRLLEAKGSAQLLDTLDAYLRRGSIKDAALALHLHRHTVIYRLDKVKELLNINLDEPSTRLGLQLAIDLRRLL